MKIYVLVIILALSPGRLTTQSVYLEDISWTVAKGLLNTESTLVIPLGAGAKEHGPHLPLSTDKIQADGLASLVAKKVNAVFAPTVSYGYYPAFIKYPGSTTTYWHTSRDMIVEIVKTLAGFGPKRFYIINIGVSTTPTLAAAASILKEQGILLYYSDYRRANFSRIDELHRKRAYGGHADDGETSNILYLRPDLVDMTKAVNDSSAKDIPGPMTPIILEGGTYNPSGINGYATLADKRTGKRYLEAFANTIAEEIAEIQKAILPGKSYTNLNEYTGTYMTQEGKNLTMGIENDFLYYEWNDIEKRNFFPLSKVSDDYFISLPLNILFVRNDAGQISKAWCQLSGSSFWVYKIKK
jgi:creatinine amidohydrolase